MGARLFDDCGAEFSDDRLFRYRLWRIWNEDLDRILWVMLNPSDADESADDPTIRKCLGFSRRWGYGSVEIANLFAFKSPYPRDLVQRIRTKGEASAVGPDNDDAIVQACGRAKTVVAAWGATKIARGRAAVVGDLLRAHHPNVVCLIRNADRSPGHPLYIPYVTPPRVFS